MGFEELPTSESRANSESAALNAGPVLLYDGECGVCNSSVQWILRHERKSTLLFASLESPLGQKLRERSGVPEGLDSLLWVESFDGQIGVRKWSDSVIAVLDYVGGPWKALSFLRWIPRPVRDGAYRLFAKHRKNLVSESCLVPDTKSRGRFLNGAELGD